MDKIKKYKKAVRETLQTHVHLPTPAFPNLQHIFVVDEHEQHFIIFKIGWQKDRYIHSTIYHLEVKDDGKIWVHELRTDVDVTTELTKKGVMAEDIVGGMLMPYTLNQATDNTKKVQLTS